MMDVTRDVKIHAAAGLMSLNKLVPAHRMIGGFYIGQKSRCSCLPRVVERMAGYVVVFE